jgi:hypothetical protein
MDKLPDLYGMDNFKNNAWCRVMSEFNSVHTRGHDQHKFMELPEEISHCCCLKLAVQKSVIDNNHLLAKYDTPAKPEFSHNEPQLDGLLHYAPYKAVFCPSKKYFECLCAAEQLHDNHPMHQHPIFHSVLPPLMALKYKCLGIYPKNLYQSNGLIVADDTWTISCPVVNGLDVSNPEINANVLLKVRRVCLKRDPTYIFKEELCGCRLTNQKYFASCSMIFDEEMDTDNVSKGVDICIITGEKDKMDLGTNEILLAARIYVNGYQIPEYHEEELDKFFEAAYASVERNGYEVFRRGGSGGYPVPDQDLLDFHKEYRASVPVVAQAAVHLPMAKGNWMVVYMSPYRDRISESVASVTYSPPRPGGQIRNLQMVAPTAREFFLRMAATRWTLPHVLQALYLATGTVISPIARDNQQMYNTIAFQNASTTSTIQKKFLPKKLISTIKTLYNTCTCLAIVPVR